MALPVVESLALALLRVATEILPLSSAGHLALVSFLFGVELAPAVEVAAGVGVWLAVAFFFRKSLRESASEIVLAVRRKSLVAAPGPGPGTEAPTNVRALAIATPAWVLIASLVHGYTGAWAKEPTLVGAGLLVSALAVASTVWAPDGDRDAPTAWGALLVGVMQGMCVLPGLSRPALALASLLWLGVKAPRAFELCFLVAVPAELFLAVFVLPWPSLPLGASAALLVLALTAGAALVSLGLLLVLRRALTTHLFPIFALYLVPLAIATTAWAYARP